MSTDWLNYMIPLALILVMLGGTYIYIGRVKGAKEELLKKRVALLFWVVFVFFVVLPGLLARFEYIHDGWFWFLLYVVLFLSLPFFYAVEKKRAALRWDRWDSQRSARRYLIGALCSFAATLFVSMPIVTLLYNPDRFGFWAKTGFGIGFVLFFYLSNRFRSRYMELRYGTETDSTTNAPSDTDS